MLGQKCPLNVVHEEKNGNDYANIAGALPLPKGMDAPDQVNESRMIDVNTATAEGIEALPESIKAKMLSSDEWQGPHKARGKHQRYAPHHSPTRIGAELAADDDGFAESMVVPDEPAS